MQKAQNSSGQLSDPKSKPVGELCDVESVYEGDTAWVVCNGQREKLRLYCIDAPEMQQKPWGRQWRDHLRSRLLVMLCRLSGWRRIGMGGSGDVDLNGWGGVYPRHCPDSEYGYRIDESSARDLKQSVWRSEGMQTRPWEWQSSK